MAAIDDLKRAGAIVVDPVRVELGDVRRVQGSGPCGGFKYDRPAINVPMGYTRGTLPSGITFFGRAWSEATLIKLAYAGFSRVPRDVGHGFSRAS